MPLKKICVEDCLRLSATKIARVPPINSATLTWTKNNKDIGSISLTRLTDTLVELRYQVEGYNAQYVIELNTTWLPWDSVRYWFTCPFCERRVAHLYPHNSWGKFACRHCCNLTYQSSQTNNKWRRLFNSLD